MAMNWHCQRASEASAAGGHMWNSTTLNTAILLPLLSLNLDQVSMGMAILSGTKQYAKEAKRLLNVVSQIASTSKSLTVSFQCIDGGSFSKGIGHV